MKLHNKKGVALVFSLFVIIILIGLASMFVLRTVHEGRMVKMEQDRAKAFYVAEAAVQAGLDGLDNLVNNFMLNTINNMNPSVVVDLAETNLSDGLNFLYETVEDNGAPLLTINGTQAEFSLASTSLGSGNYQYDIVITEKSDPVIVAADIWDFPYNYRIETAGTVNGQQKQVILNGDFTVRVQRDNFAKYALFTNQQTLENGTNVWFTNKTNFAGPLHTNGRYNIALNPSGTFEGLVEQSEQLARFYNNGSTILLDDDHNGIKDVPIFNDGFNRGVDGITLASSVQKQSFIDQVDAGNSYSTNGIYLPYSGSNLTGGIYVRGDSNISISVNGSNQAVYTITQGGTTKNITVDRVLGQTSIETVGQGTSVYSGVPDGVDSLGTVIYVNGNINSLSGTVQQDTAVTIASENDVVIQNNLTYANYTAGSGTPGTVGYVPPSAMGASNLLGIVSWEGDVRIGTSAPDNVSVHGTVLAANGKFQVDSYNNTGTGPRGTATILGGVITDYYGAFGLFSGSTGQQLSGYGRNFVYDERMQVGSSPPYFPTLNTFVAFTNDITDKMVWQEVDS